MHTWGIFLYVVFLPGGLRVAVLLTSRLTAPRECTKRSWQKLLVFSNLASAVTQHFCILFITAVIKECSGSRAGMGHHLSVRGSRRIYGHVLKPPPALRWLMRSCTVVGTTGRNSTLGGKRSFLLVLLSLCCLCKFQVEISCR